MQTVNQGNRFLTTCPSCNRRWKIADGYEDSPVICPLCGSKFVARRALEGQEPPPGKGRGMVRKVVAGLAWGVCLSWTGLTFLSAARGLALAQSAPQEAAVAAAGAFSIIAGYVAVRCVHELSRLD